MNSIFDNILVVNDIFGENYTFSLSAANGSAYFGNGAITLGNSDGAWFNVDALGNTVAYSLNINASSYLNPDGSASFGGGNFVIANDGSLTSSLSCTSVDIGSTYGELFIGDNGFLGLEGTNPIYLFTESSQNSQIGNIYFNATLPGFPDPIDLNYDGSASFATGLTLLNSDGSGEFAGGLLIFDNAGNLNATSLLAPYTIITSSTSLPAGIGSRVAANTSGGAFTITLPVAASPGATVDIIDAEGTWGTHNLTVSPPIGKKINNSTSSLTFSSSAHLLFVYINNSYGWRQT